ncbi:MAG: CcmD family protein [Gemmatimonadetes bacterium]|nr:CcmD family protein [Gemmatimonadota bacterium]
MRHIRIVLIALLALLAAPSATRAQVDTGAATTTYQPAPAGAAAALPARETPPRSLRAYWHVFIAFAIAWVLLFGYVVLIARRSRRLEEQLDGLARP